ncbi:MAG: hypothetical protein WC564_01340 [Patescibacteria group bacterium]
MFDYFEKFNKLDQKIKEKVSNQFVVEAIDELEKKYGIDLALVVMMVMVKAILVNDLAIYLSDQFSLSEEKAKSLALDLKEKVFLGVADYLEMDLSQLFTGKTTPPIISEPVIATNKYVQEIDTMVRATIVEINLGLSPDLSEKLVSTLKLYWREIRNKIDTRVLLVKPIKDNGFALTGVVADNLLGILDKKKQIITNVKQAEMKKPNSSVLDKISQLAKSSARYESDYNLASFLDTKRELTSGIDLSHELAPVPVAPALPKVESKPIIEKVELPQPIKPIVIAPPVQPQPIVVPVAPIRPVEVLKKPQVEDIKSVRVMNPIDELRYLDLVNFRRMSDDPVDITKKIKSRIKLLEGEDYEKGLAGVTAWRQSPVNKLYLKIVNSSLNDNQTIPQVVDGLKAKKQDALTLEEVEAIISLNSELKF